MKTKFKKIKKFLKTFIDGVAEGSAMATNKVFEIGMY